MSEVLKVWLTPQECADYLGISVFTLEKYRRAGTGPTPHLIGDKLIRYWRTSVDEWLHAHAINKPRRRVRAHA